MKTKHVFQLALATFVLFAIAQPVFAQRGNRAMNSQSGTTCVYALPNLTADQATAIQALVDSHQKDVDLLRNERRATFDERTKAEIRLKMLDLRDAHRAAVNKLLTSEQQKAYSAINRSGGRGFNTDTQRSGRGCGLGNQAAKLSRGGGQRGYCR
jgi:hypothetical protein